MCAFAIWHFKGYYGLQKSFYVAWIRFNPGMDMLEHTSKYVGWNHVCIPKPQPYSRLSLEKDK